MFKLTQEMKLKLSALQKAGYYHYSTKTHQSKIDAATKWANESDSRSELSHFCEEMDEVIDFESREHAVEELGDLIFTALRFVNSELECHEERITLLEVLEGNLLKLSHKKKVAKHPIVDCSTKSADDTEMEFLGNRKRAVPNIAASVQIVSHHLKENLSLTK